PSSFATGTTRQQTTWSRLSGALPGPPRIESISQTVADEVDGDDGDHDGETRCDGQERRRQGELLSLVEHVAPGRGGRLDAQSQVGEGGLCEQRAACDQGRCDQQWTLHVRQDVTKEYPPVLGTQ